MPHRIFATRRLPGAAFEALLADPDYEVAVWPGDAPPPRADLLREAAGADGILCLITDAIDEAVLDAAGGGLKIVSQMAVGVDNIDAAACAARGIAVGRTPGVLTDTTADLAWALILATARRLVEAADYVRAGEWKTWSPTQLAGTDVHGASLGIVGFGAIGQAVARRARGFDMTVRYWNRTPRPAEAAELGAEFAEFDELLAASDFVSINVALTDGTRGLIDAAALAKMRPEAILINTARGPVVDEAALAEALANGVIAAAGLDVTAVEPIAGDSPLLSMPNAIVLPHVGSSSLATRSKMADIAVSNLRAALEGRPIPHPAPRPA